MKGVCVTELECNQRLIWSFEACRFDEFTKYNHMKRVCIIRYQEHIFVIYQYKQGTVVVSCIFFAKVWTKRQQLCGYCLGLQWQEVRWRAGSARTAGFKVLPECDLGRIRIREIKLPLGSSVTRNPLKDKVCMDSRLSKSTREERCHKSLTRVS